jgi:hypothetical protein
VSSAIHAISRGDYTSKISVAVTGKDLDLKNQINALMDQLRPKPVTVPKIIPLIEIATENYINSIPSDVHQYILTVQTKINNSQFFLSFCPSNSF